MNLPEPTEHAPGFFPFSYLEIFPHCSLGLLPRLFYLPLVPFINLSGNLFASSFSRCPFKSFKIAETYWTSFAMRLTCSPAVSSSLAKLEMPFAICRPPLAESPNTGNKADKFCHD